MEHEDIHRHCPESVYNLYCQTRTGDPRSTSGTTIHLNFLPNRPIKSTRIADTISASSGRTENTRTR
ncbi:hypothetical protein Bpfe_024830, partial [Biomphalaria pfeifferi]